MSRRRKYTNIAGLAVLGFFVIAIIAVSGSKWLTRRSEVRDTEKLLNYVAAGFANSDHEIMKQWAIGGPGFKDSWGNQLVIKSKEGEEGYRFVSKGPDGELETEDDISSRVHKLTLKTKAQDIFTKKPHIKEENPEEPEENPSTFDKAKEWLKKKWSKDE